MLFVLSEPVGQIVSFDPCMKVQQHDRKYQKITPQIVRRDREFLHGFRPEKNFLSSESTATWRVESSRLHGQKLHRLPIYRCIFSLRFSDAAFRNPVSQ